MFENGFSKHWSTLKKLIWLVGSGVAGGASGVIKIVSGAIVHITDALAKPAISLVCQINPVQASGTPTPKTPLPITGFTGLTVDHIGENLFETCTFESGYYLNDGSPAASGDFERSVNYTPVSNGDVLVFEGTNIRPSPGYFRVHGYNSNKEWVAQILTVSTPTDVVSRETVVIPNGISYIRFSWFKPTLRKDAMFGNGETIQVSWQTEAGTVYGGSGEIVSGALASNMGAVDMGNLTWTYYTGGENPIFTATVSDIKQFGAAVLPKLLSSIYKTITTRARATFAGNAQNGEITTTVNGITIFVRDDRYTDAATFKTALSGVQLVYELAQPVVYQLDPVTVNLLLGENNLWHDANGNTELTYYAG